MTDRLFSLEQQVQRAKEEGLSAAQAYEDTSGNNRLLALQQSLTEAMEIQSTVSPYTASLSQSTYSQPFAGETETWVIKARKTSGDAIHGFTPPCPPK